MELTSNSLYITSNYVYDSVGTVKVEINGEYVIPVRELHSPELLVGKKVIPHHSTIIDENIPTLAGIIDSDSMYNGRYVDNVAGFFARSDFESMYVESLWLNPQSLGKASNSILQLGDVSFSDPVQIKLYGERFNVQGKVLTYDGRLLDPEDFAVNDNEIVITYELYEQLFTANSKGYYVDDQLTQVRNIPEHLGETFSLQISSLDDVVLGNFGDVKLAGISFVSWDTANQRFNEFYGHAKLIRQIEMVGARYCIVSTNSVKNLASFLTTLRSKNCTLFRAGRLIKSNGEFMNSSDVVNYVFAMEELLTIVGIAFICICAILTVILILLVINMISFSIANRKKEIGILSALGTSNKDITKIFLLETLFISVITFVVAFVCDILISNLFNLVICKNIYSLGEVIPFFQFSMLTLAILIVSCFGLLLFAAWIPIRKIAKLKPIDAIRNL